jgi:uncharacterized protein YbaP (TraB family)
MENSMKTRRTALLMNRILLMGILLITFWAGNLSAQQSGHSLLWEISGNNLEQPSYLFGTFHLLQDEFLGTKPEVLNRYRSAEQVMVEVQIDSSKMQQLSMMAVMQGDLISNYLSDEEAALVSEVLTSTIGVGLTQVDMLKPMALMATISMIQNQTILGEKLTGYSGLVMDHWFATDGKRSGKDIIALESLEEQMDLLFNTTSVEEQAEQLVSYLQNEEESFELIETLFNCYVSEDLPCLNQIGVDMATEMPSMTAFLDVRNENWMEKIPALIQQKPSFIAVGALHLTGEMGLIELLRGEGYRVEPLQTNPG